MESFKKFWESFESSTRTGICVAIVLIASFATGNFIGSITNINQTAPLAFAQQANAPAAVQSTPVVATTSAPTTQPAAPATGDTSAPAAPSNSAPQSVEEIVKLFNDSVNKVKTEATKVTKNFEMRNYDETQSVVPSALNSLASSLINEYLGDDTEPIEYATKEDIIANYQVPEQTYSSQLTAADVLSATCTDNGTEYEITLNLADSVNPVQGSGVGAACDVIEAEQVTSNGAVAAILKEFSINYSGCVIKCKIDKASNHVTWANYLTPLSIDALVSVLVASVDAKVVLSFEKDYTITY